ncbi:MAG: galactokinase, partial [Eubacteriales bacterium]|nr:galactokinase [Eubacteriales bacterium]
LSVDEFEKIKNIIEDEICQKRSCHVVYENERTKKAVAELEKNNLKEFGKLLNESHKSLKELYEVTGIELDTLVEISLKQEGVLGSRMTGAGFGGCTISLVQEEFIPEFIKNVGNKYKEKIGYDASFYTVQVGSGTRKL